MDAKRKITAIIFFIIFIICGLVLYSGIFDQPRIIFRKNPLDHFFLIMLNVMFWFPGSYFANKIIDYVVWKKIIGVPVGDFSFRWIQAFIEALLYTVAIAMVMDSALFVPLSNVSIIILYLLLYVFALIKPKLLLLVTNEFFEQSQPYNKGDWVKVSNPDGEPVVTGEVYNFHRGAVSIKNEDNNLVFISNHIISNSIIENFRSFKNDSRFGINAGLDGKINIERGKRILNSAILSALDECKIHYEHKPEIMISEINASCINYEIKFWMKPWIGASPSQIKDMIYSKIIEYTKVARIQLADNFSAESSNLNSAMDRSKILGDIWFFNALNQDEVELIAAAVKIHYLKKGDRIISQGDTGNSMFILIEGLLDVKINKENDENIKVGRLTPGNIFGEMSLFTGEPRSATVEVYSDCVVFELTKESINPIIQQRTNLVDAFGKMIAERQSTNAELIAQSNIKQQSVLELVVSKIKSFFHLK